MHNSVSYNWAGTDAGTTHSYTEVTSDVVVPHTVLTCSNSTVSLWTGLGNAKLLQNGVADYGSTANQWHWWFEAVWGSSDTGEVNVGGSVSPGQSMYLDTYYDTSTLQVQFFWYNNTTGQSNSYTSGYINGHPAGYYYDSQYSEAIVERQTRSGAYTSLRKWDSGDVPFTNAYVYWASGSNAIRYVTHYDVDMWDSSGLNRQLASWVSKPSLDDFSVHHETACS